MTCKLWHQTTDMCFYFVRKMATLVCRVVILLVAPPKNHRREVKQTWPSVRK